MQFNKLNTYQAISLILIVIVNHLILDLPNNFIDECGSGAIINSIFIIFLGLLFCIIILKLFKHFTNSDLLDISYFLGGKVLKIIIAILFIIYLLFTISVLLRDFSEGLILTYFTEIPLYLLLILFLIPPAISNKLGFKIIMKANSFIVPIMITSFIILIMSTISSFQVQKAFPVLGYGYYNTFFSGASNVFAFSGLGFLYFLLPILKNKTDFKKITYISFIITSILLFLSILSLILSFSFLRFLNELSPIYLLVRATNYGNFFQRPESIFIFIWILSFIAYMSSLIIFILYLLKKTLNIKHTNSLSFLISNIIFIIALIPSSIWQVKYLQSTVYKYFSLILFLGVGLPIIILANIKRIKLKGVNKND